MARFEPSHVVPSPGLSAWRSADVSGPPAATLPAGTEVSVLERRGSWARVEAANGWQGWVDGDRLIPRAAAPGSWDAPPSDFRPWEAGGTPPPPPPPAGGGGRTPLAGPRETVEARSGTATASRVLLVIVGVGHAVTALVIAYGLGLVQEDAERLVPQHTERLDELANLLAGVAGIQLLAGIALIVVWIVWFHGSYKALRSLGQDELRYDTGQAAWSWFVPVFNFIRPKQIADDLWKLSEPDRMVVDAAGRNAAPRVRPLVHWWWATWVGSIALTAISSFVEAGIEDSFDPTLEEVTGLLSLLVFTAVVSAISAFLAYRFVGDVRDRQRRRAATFTM